MSTKITIALPQLGPDEEKAVIKVLRSGYLSSGREVLEFEKNFSQLVGAKYAVAVTNGTAALYLSLLALGIGKGDEVITTPFSFIATANAIVYTGAKPVFADIEEGTYNIDPQKIVEKITKKTKAILPVHLFGLPANLDQILKISKNHNIPVVEDAAQAHGAIYKGKKVGSIGKLGCFSFYPTKNMTTGEGGIITTNDRVLFQKLNLLRSHGMKQRYYHSSFGFNYRLTNIQAAIGNIQLRKLEMFNHKRINNAQLYNKELAQVNDIRLPQNLKDGTCVFHQYSILLKNSKIRNGLKAYLLQKGVESEVYYPLPIHLQPIYKKNGMRFAISENVSKRILSLPVHPGVKSRDILRITKLIKFFLSSQTLRKK